MTVVKTIVALAGVATLLGAAGAARAADLPVRTAPPPYVAPLPLFTWTGAYFGVNAGAAFDNDTRFAIADNLPTDKSVGTGNRPAAFKAGDGGFTAGG